MTDFLRYCNTSIPVVFLSPEISLSPALSSGTCYKTYRSASLVTVSGDVCQTPESWLVSSPELAHLRTVHFALSKCTHYCYYYLSS